MKRMTFSTVLLAGLAVVLALLASAAAQAEILGWVDAAGNVTYSNLPPPKDARVIDQIKEVPVDAQAQAAAATLHQSQMQALNDRVRDLERQLNQSQHAAPSVVYAPPPPAAGAGCDSQYYDCASWDGPIYTTVGLPYLRPGRHHPEGRPRGPRHFAQNMAANPRSHAGAGFRR
jgi:hypothetical protein